MDCSLRGSSIHGIFQARLLEWVAISPHDRSHFIHKLNRWFVVVAQLLSCPTLCDLMNCSTPSLSTTNSQSLLKLMSIKSVMPSNHIVHCHPLPLPPSIFPSIRLFYNKLVLHIRWPKYWSLSLTISPSNEYSGLISLKIDWFDLLAVHGTLKSLLQHHSSKASFFGAPVPQFKSINSSVLSFPYRPTLTSIHDYWKNHSFD